MTDKTYTVQDLIGFAAGQNVAEFQTALGQILDQRAADAIEGARAEVASTFINTPEEESEEEITDEDPDEDAETA